MKNAYRVDGDVTYINLRHGSGFMQTIIDTDDLSKVSELSGSWVVKWNPTAKTFYARANNPRVYMHRWITGTVDPNIQIDHEDHNGLNNRRTNLIISNVMGNGFNRRGAQSNCTSGKRNVYWNAREGRWMVWLVHYGKRYYSGYYTNVEAAEEEAIKLREYVISLSPRRKYDNSRSRE